jgi:endonuclease-3
LNRIGLVETNTPEKTFYKILGKIPENAAHSFHTNLIRLGREICKPANPACSICPLLKFCKFDHKSLTGKIKNKTISFMLLDNL